MLTFSLEVRGAGADDVRIGGVLDADQITFSRGGTSELVRIRWYVTTWDGMTVQRGVTTLPVNTFETTQALDRAVDPAQSFVLATFYGVDGQFDEADLVRAELVTSDMLRFPVQASNGTTAFAPWQVIEIPGSRVQHGALPLADGQLTRTLAIQPYDLDRSLLVYTQSAPLVGGFAHDLFVRGTADAANTLHFDRYAGLGPQTISWSLIELPGMRVQHGSAAFADGAGLVTVPIAAVDPARALPFGGGFAGTGGGTSDTNDSSPTTAWGTLDLSSQELRITRRGVTGTADLPWSVIDMP